MSAWTAARPDSARRVSRLIGDLLGTRPAADADVGERARWTARRADVFAEVARVHEADGDVVSAGAARAEAADAERQAARLDEVAAAQPTAIADDERCDAWEDELAAGF